MSDAYLNKWDGFHCGCGGVWIELLGELGEFERIAPAYWEMQLALMTINGSIR
jgi:hypothetical protein